MGRGLWSSLRCRPSASIRFFREVCSIRFLLTAVSLLSLFLAGELVLKSPGASALYVWSQTVPIFSYMPQAHSAPSAQQAPSGPSCPPKTQPLQASFLLTASFCQGNPLPSLSLRPPTSFSSTLVGASVPGPSSGECELGRLSWGGQLVCYEPGGCGGSLGLLGREQCWRL